MKLSNNDYEPVIQAICARKGFTYAIPALLTDGVLQSMKSIGVGTWSYQINDNQIAINFTIHDNGNYKSNVLIYDSLQVDKNVICIKAVLAVLKSIIIHSDPYYLIYQLNTHHWKDRYTKKYISEHVEILFCWITDNKYSINIQDIDFQNNLECKFKIFENK